MSNGQIRDVVRALEWDDRKCFFTTSEEFWRCFEGWEDRIRTEEDRAERFPIAVNDARRHVEFLEGLVLTLSRQVRRYKDEERVRAAEEVRITPATRRAFQ